MRKNLFNFAIAALCVAFVGCGGAPKCGAYSDIDFNETLAVTFDGDFRSGYELETDNALYLPIDPARKCVGIDISWSVPMDIGIIGVVEVKRGGDFESVAELFPSNCFNDYVSYDFDPAIDAKLLRIRLTEGIARVNEFIVRYQE